MSNAEDIYDDESAANCSTQLSIPFSASRPHAITLHLSCQRHSNTNRLSRTKWRHFSHSIFSRIAFQRSPLSTFGEGNLFMSSLIPAWMSENTKWWRNVTMSMVWAVGEWKLFGIMSCGRLVIVLRNLVFPLSTMILAQIIFYHPQSPTKLPSTFHQTLPVSVLGREQFFASFCPRPSATKRYHRHSDFAQQTLERRETVAIKTFSHIPFIPCNILWFPWAVFMENFRPRRFLLSLLV